MVFFTIYSNFTLIPEFTFAKLQDFLLNWNLLFQFTFPEFYRQFARKPPVK